MKTRRPATGRRVKPKALPARRKRANWLVHGVALSSVGSAFAQGKGGAHAPAQQDLIQRGRALFDDQQYEESIQALSAALVRPSNTKAQKLEIYRLLLEEAAKGRTFVWYTTENDELAYCDKTYVFRSGQVTQELSASECTEEALLAASFEEVSE